MFKVIGLSLISFCLPLSQGMAAPAAPDLTQALKRLQSVGFSSSYTRKLKDLMDRQVEAQGELFFTNGKLRIEQTKPDKTLLVYDGQTAWQEQEYDDGNSKRTVVTKVKNVKRSSAILASLLSDQDLFKTFKLGKQTKKDKKILYDLVPRNKKAEVKKLRIEIENRELSSIFYLDELENQVTYYFKKIKVEAVPNKKFKYSPPKGAEVSEV